MALGCQGGNDENGYIPPAQYRTTERYVAYVDGFARNGYIVIRPDYRGHGDSEGKPATAYDTPAYTIAVLNAMASAQRLPEADPHRVGMWGHSMGGTITLRAMVVNADIKAGVIWAGGVADYPELMDRWQRRFSASGTPGAGTPTPPRRWGDILFTYEGDNHNISNNFGAAMRRSVAFFDLYIKGE